VTDVVGSHRDKKVNDFIVFIRTKLASPQKYSVLGLLRAVVGKDCPLDADLREDPVNKAVLCDEPVIFNSRGRGHETYFQHSFVVWCGVVASLHRHAHEVGLHRLHGT
jgi:hypothetical protein